MNRPVTPRHLFGPVFSRRLGRSLGVDLVPFKTCSYDCVYCECGATTCLSVTRQEFFPVREVLDELDKFLESSPGLDYITLSGDGEPTLSLSLGEVIRHIRNQYPSYRIAVLTNASLLGVPQVRLDLRSADLVLPTFSTMEEETFRAIHRPVPGITARSILDGIVQFRREFSGEIWLEVFIIPGMNTSDDELAELRRVIPLIHPDRIQVNTLDRPGTEGWVNPASQEEIERVLSVLGLTDSEGLASEYH
ncbi:MAG: radical SAM protein [Methanomicrobiales archaeon HGW-Methanomicrobiales-4]|nr:MAG: radical SAM protein [Methanomicrobiales archaeon HGW-Methanomicrobiales-4]